MSKIKLQSNQSGTATFTIESPATNTDRVLVLPDNTGTVLTSASDLAAANLTGNVAAARITDALNASGSAPIYACRAWVNFDGTTSPGTIRASGNVSSVTRNGTGDYTVNFTTAMPDVNYATLIENNDDVGGNLFDRRALLPASGTYSTTAVQIISGVGATTFTNFSIINVTVFR